MILLQCSHFKFPFDHGFNGKHRGVSPCQGRCVGDVHSQCGTSNGIGFGNSPFALRRVDNQLDVSVFHHVQNVRPPLSHLEHGPVSDTVLMQVGGGPFCGNNFETKIVEEKGGFEHGHLVLILDADKHRPRQGQLLSRGQLRFCEGQTEVFVNAHDLSSGLHFRPQQRIHTRKPTKGKNRFFDGNVRRRHLPSETQFLQPFSHDHLGGQLGQRNTGRFTHKGNGPRGSGVHFQHIDDAVLDRILNVHQSHHIQFSSQRFRAPLNLAQDSRVQRNGRQHTGAVPAVNPRLFDMLHNPTDKGRLSVRDGVHIDFNRMVQEAVNQHRLAGRHLHSFSDIELEVGLVVYDFHSPAPQDKRRPHHYRITDGSGHLYGLFLIGGNAVLRLANVQFFQKRLKALPILCAIYAVRARSKDGDPRLCQGNGKIERGLPSKLNNDPFRPLLPHNIQHIFPSQGLEIKLIRGVVIRAHRLRIAIDHNAFNAQLPESE